MITDRELPRIVGIGGRAGSGKDTVAQYLIEKCGYIRVGFADALKREVEQRFKQTLKMMLGKYSGFEHHPAEWWDAYIHMAIWVHRPPAIRSLLQEFGTEVRRADDPGYWVTQWSANVDPIVAGGARVVVPDCRFSNELDAIRSRGGCVWRVVREGTSLLQSLAQHESEHALEAASVDREIHNDGSFEDLYAQVDRALGRMHPCDL